MAQIIQGRLDGVEFDDGLLDDISLTTRGNARSAVKRAKEIETYCESNNDPKFTRDSWYQLRKVLGIKPLGLTNIEVQILEILNERGPSKIGRAHV